MSSLKLIFRLLLLALFAVGLFVWFGIFNIAANDPHWDVTTKLLEVVRDRSVSVRANAISIPDLSDTSRVKRGAANYSAMCEQCHLAPGIETSELYEGLYPKPPVLYKEDDFAESPDETFWIIKNGIKMTGMPAWGINNSDAQIWDMIALISALDSLGAEEYKEMVESGTHAHKGEGHSASANNADTDDHSEEPGSSGDSH